ncbi:hypothetical protein OCB08_01385 [Bacillus cereus]|uniref:hypothetical protein n=1 Tax=Bacillus cereus TaxID=1396 RepID=UPI0008639A8A|nr:hypothetical protein [Bacillus cereus]AOM07590.1 hypothetical protein FORC24_4300 [Bacillus cereus]MCC2366302.1 hypothetical protein [Bacillus cereus]MCC2451936.1 hypothetical protein [Bacillus cereus]MCC2490918.1 hypothetical protein [Bacillus cereus]MCU5624066.1 hypothetical protein [Bacillus cereus]
MFFFKQKTPTRPKTVELNIDKKLLEKLQTRKPAESKLTSKEKEKEDLFVVKS